MTAIDRRIVEALCLAASATAESLIPGSGVAPGSARAIARAHRVRVERLSAVKGGV